MHAHHAPEVAPLEAARALVPEIEARADEIASLRRLPLDLVARLRSAGLFRMSMPRAWGGLELSPREQIEIVETLSYADASVGWCVKAGADGGFFCSFLDEEAARGLYGHLDAVTAGQMLPSGHAEHVPGGYRVSGRWGFASGCTHADLIFAHCPVLNGDSRKNGGMRSRELRVVLAPASRWKILDTWYTTGLAGTGSHHFTADGIVIPEEHTFSLADGPRRDEPLYAYPGMFLSNMPGVALGLARRAIDTVRDCIRRKCDAASPPDEPTNDVPRLRTALAQAEMLFGAARSYTYGTIDEVWSCLTSGKELSRELRIAVALSRVNAFRAAREVAQLMFNAGGTPAIYSRSPLDRLLRDAISVAQHAMLHEDYLQSVGAIMLGEEPQFAVL